MSKKKIKKKKKIGTLKKPKPIDVADYLSVAIQHHRTGQLLQAIQIYQKIIQAQPNNHSALNLFGLALYKTDRLDEALSHLSKAAVLSPSVAKYHYDLGLVYQSSGFAQQSIGHYRSALKLDPRNSAAWENLGVALSDCGHNQEAISAYEDALAINPKSILALTNLSTMRRWQGSHQQALDLLNNAIQIDPTHISARMKRAEVLLSCGDFEQGWDEYAWRLVGAGRPEQDMVRYVPIPRWDGQFLPGKTLLVHTEQGIGDEVMFASCLPDLIKEGMDCHLVCDSRMVSAFRRSFPEIGVSSNSSEDWGLASELVNADMRVPIGDLPRIYRTATEKFPQQESYLKAAPELVGDWHGRLAQLGPGLKIGLSWRGGRQKYTQKARSISLKSLTPLLSVSGATFVNLQYGDCKEELSTLSDQIKPRLHCFEDVDPLVDLEAFLALIANLDLVISVDNSTVHFAGALGVPTWMLLPALADWRWPVDGTNSRWYPSVQLIRQQPDEQGDWTPVIDLVVQKIPELKPRSVEISEGLIIPPEDQLKQKNLSPEASAPQALLLNDTSFWYHWGCTCTSLAIRNSLKERGWAVRGVPIDYLRSLPPVPVDSSQWNDRFFESFRKERQGLLERVEKTDVLVVNGEGSLHGGNPLPVSLLYLMHLGKTRFGKPVHVINHSCYPDDQPEPSGSKIESLYRAVYSELDHVAVRESVSATLLKKLGIAISQSFDCLPLFIEQFRPHIRTGEPRQIVFAGSVAWDQEMLEAIRQLVMDVAAGQCVFLYGANAYPAGDDGAIIQQLQSILPGRVQLLYAKSELEWLRTIASAKLLVSGRFHHSIAAACLQTPFIVLDSNTPKISGLMQMLELQTHISCKSPQPGNQLVELSRELLNNPEQGLLSEHNHNRILRLAADNFMGLG